MNYQEALAYLYSFTDFERGASFKRDRSDKLPRMLSLLDALSNPQQDYSSTLIAGTKGKGSTASLIERVLREAGIRTGLYTQPDLHTFRERMRINGQLISEEEVAELVPEVKSAIEGIQARHEFGDFITYEAGTALAFLYFSRKSVRHAVLEVGLGGRLDATNTTHPLVSVITSISYDHMQILGNTLREIATEKAGIIKQNGLVITSAQSPEALLAIAAVCNQRAARLIRIGAHAEDPAQQEVETGNLPALSYSYTVEEQQHFTIWTPERKYEQLEIPLIGVHQIENATVALATLEELRRQGLAWNEADLRRGFQAVHWPARIEVVGHQPTIVVDGAHNADSMEKLVQALRSNFSMQRLIIVLATNQDKDQAGIVQALASADSIIITRVKSPRATSLETLHKICMEYAPHATLYEVDESHAAMQKATELATAQDLICATGSLYLAGEVLRWAAARGDQGAQAEIAGVDHP